MKPLLKSTKNPDKKRLDLSEECFNLTHLNPSKELMRFRFAHRDFLAHSFRYVYAANYIFKNYKRDEANVLDVGIAPDWNQLIAIHSNGAFPKLYLGVDARDCSKTMPKVNFKADFNQVNIVESLPIKEDKWDVVICFEVIEHMTKNDGIKLLDNLSNITDDKTVVLLSTPCFNGTMAENHIYEWQYQELKDELEKKFTIDSHYGTFASLKDYTPLMNEAELKLLSKLKEYYNSALISCIMAPLYPEQSRNVMWVLKKK